ncbi:squalene synthase HpnC [Granulicella sp. S190]|uniref:squalene synthase HpnC n=1 Tax=Granulicella sp. S190 TaxID=1747226 RepID=UPI00131D59EA|nr:squalene synthase HpnC [Granulicella sp. S190]
MSETTEMQHALLGAPHEYLTPLEQPTLAEAQAWCTNLATSHDENFLLARFFLPGKVRPHFESIYAYCRVANDLGDEVEDREVAARLLHTWGAMLEECYDAPERTMHPVFVALHETIRECDPPRELFLDLLHGFRMNQYKTEYASWEELVEYSHYSANPVGRLVLWVCGYTDEARGLMSDKVCTGLHLANFWQDVVVDAERGRRYIPAESMLRFGVDEGQIVGRVFTPEFRAMMEDLVERTRAMLVEGGEISRHVDKDLKVVLDLFRKGGEAILNGIAKDDYDVLRGRPVGSKLGKIGLLIEAAADKLRAGISA